MNDVKAPRENFGISFFFKIYLSEKSALRYCLILGTSNITIRNSDTNIIKKF